MRFTSKFPVPTFCPDQQELMEINCPSCDEVVLIADEDKGTKIECPFCQQRFEYETPPLVEKLPPPIVKQPPAEPTFVSDLKRDGVHFWPLSKQDTNPLIQCPSCGKDVSKLAYTCPNCAHPITKRYWAALAGLALTFCLWFIAFRWIMPHWEWGPFGWDWGPFGW